MSGKKYDLSLEGGINNIQSQHTGECVYDTIQTILFFADVFRDRYFGTFAQESINKFGRDVFQLSEPFKNTVADRFVKSGLAQSNYFKEFIAKATRRYIIIKLQEDNHNAEWIKHEFGISDVTTECPIPLKKFQSPTSKLYRQSSLNETAGQDIALRAQAALFPTMPLDLSTPGIVKTMGIRKDQLVTYYDLFKQAITKINTEFVIDEIKGLFKFNDEQLKRLVAIHILLISSSGSAHSLCILRYRNLFYWCDDESGVAVIIPDQAFFVSQLKSGIAKDSFLHRQVANKQEVLINKQYTKLLQINSQKNYDFSYESFSIFSIFYNGKSPWNLPALPSTPSPIKPTFTVSPPTPIILKKPFEGTLSQFTHMPLFKASKAIAGLIDNLRATRKNRCESALGSVSKGGAHFTQTRRAKQPCGTLSTSSATPMPESGPTTPPPAVTPPVVSPSASTSANNSTNQALAEFMKLHGTTVLEKVRNWVAFAYLNAPHKVDYSFATSIRISKDLKPFKGGSAEWVPAFSGHSLNSSFVDSILSSLDPRWLLIDRPREDPKIYQFQTQILPGILLKQYKTPNYLDRFRDGEGNDFVLDVIAQSIGFNYVLFVKQQKGGSVDTSILWREPVKSDVWIVLEWDKTSEKPEWSFLTLYKKTGTTNKIREALNRKVLEMQGWLKDDYRADAAPVFESANITPGSTPTKPGNSFVPNTKPNTKPKPAPSPPPPPPPAGEPEVVCRALTIRQARDLYTALPPDSKSLFFDQFIKQSCYASQSVESLRAKPPNYQVQTDDLRPTFNNDPASVSQGGRIEIGNPLYKLVTRGEGQSCLIHSIVQGLSFLYRTLPDVQKEAVVETLRRNIIPSLIPEDYVGFDAQAGGDLNRNHFVRMLQSGEMLMDNELALFMSLFKFNSIVFADRSHQKYLFLENLNLPTLLIYNMVNIHFETVVIETPPGVYQFHIPPNTYTEQQLRINFGTRTVEAVCDYNTGQIVRYNGEEYIVIERLFGDASSVENRCTELLLLKRSAYDGRFESDPPGTYSRAEKDALRASGNLVNYIIPRT